MSSSDKPVLTGDNRHENGQFKKGTSGNPNGRPKGSMSIPDMLKRIGEEEVPNELQDRVQRLFGEAEIGKISMLEAVLSSLKTSIVSIVFILSCPVLSRTQFEGVWCTILK